jgi:hypothetical protein
MSWEIFFAGTQVVDSLPQVSRKRSSVRPWRRYDEVHLSLFLFVTRYGVEFLSLTVSTADQHASGV